MERILFTGFPGFLGSELLPRVMARSPDAEVVCLVQPKYMVLARRRAAEMGVAGPARGGRLRLEPGDIVHADLGLGAAADEIVASATEIYHLAAVYDLSVEHELAVRVNVDGTRNVLALAERCVDLRRLHYVSTCYVSGRYPGEFTEAHLEEGRSFNNHYEATKHRAEVLVRSAMRGGLPATIYRPAITVGDSATGETQKYDGPYYVMRWLLRQPRVAVMPVVGDAARNRVNVVPRDFVIDAIAYLSGRPDGEGKTYQLADPEPLTVDAMLTELARATGRRVVRVPLPLGVAKAAIDRVPGVDALMGIPSSAVDYFVHPTRYGTEDTRTALADGGIRCPRFPEYVDRLVAFMRRNPTVRSAAMV